MRRGFKSKLITGFKRFVTVGTVGAMVFSMAATSDFSSKAYVSVPAGGLTDYNYSDIDYNYAKLLQYSLYMYDANMCGTDVGEVSLLDWRNDCHTTDKATYTRKDGKTVTLDLTGGYHDAGDHVKFGLPEAYAGFVLGMSYDTHKAAYEAAGQTGHLKDITARFADYLYRCAVLDANGNVEAFCVQIGQGGAGYDHGYWGAPENQDNSNRPIHFATSNTPCTDIVSLSAACLAMEYKNFGDVKYLDMAKRLFAFAKNNNKNTNHPDSTIGTYYYSSGWEDDYCLAAMLLYNITGDQTYYNEYQAYRYAEKAQNMYWALSWDNVAPALMYYAGDASGVNNSANVRGNTTYGGYNCLLDWGSARYNTGIQYMGLVYDKMSGTNTHRGYAEGQMKYLLGNNAAKQCFVVGYNNYSPKYPHHRAASGYTGSVQGTREQAHVLIGALVGGQDTNGGYDDTASNYQYNEVSIDYNATLVAAAAAIYSGHIGESGQSIDSDYYDDNAGSTGGGSTGGNEGGSTGGGSTGGNEGGSTGGGTTGGSESGSTGGGSTGGNEGGSTGGGTTGGSESGSTGGGTTGGNEGGSTGGGSTGGNEDSSTGGGSTGGSTGGNAGGSTGGNTGGASEDNYFGDGVWFAYYQECDFYKYSDGNVRCFYRNSKLPVINEFKCDGIYTYYFQLDGTAMKDRLTYHPNGVNIIYFDSEGHEVFSNFAHVKKSIEGNPVDDLCFFNVYGYMYVDVVTYDQAGVNLYYANPYGVMERNGWFTFSAAQGGGYGYANADGTLMKDTWTYDWTGRLVYMDGDGSMRGSR